MATGILRALSDDEVQDLISDLAREHLLSPEWAPTIGGWLGASWRPTRTTAPSTSAWTASRPGCTRTASLQRSGLAPTALVGAVGRDAPRR
jgi:hypothetical protein